MPRTLYELGSEELRLAESLDACEGDLSKVEGLEAFLDQHAADLDAKLEGYVRLIRQLELEASGAKAEKEQWAAKEKSLAARADFLKGRLKEFLERTGQKEIRTATGRSIMLRPNGGSAPLVFTDLGLASDYSLDPNFHDCTLTKIEWDKDRIRERLKAGDDLPFVVLGEPGNHLRIR